MFTCFVDFNKKCKNIKNDGGKNVMMKEEIKSDGFVDITDESCPYTIVKAKVALDDINVGEVLEIKMETGVPCRSLPKVMHFDGHEVLEMKDNEDGTHTMYVKKMTDF